jgi:hypothetical protein
VLAMAVTCLGPKPTMASLSVPTTEPRGP